MSASKRALAKGTTQKFHKLPLYVLNHPVFPTLSGSAVKLYLEFARQYNGFNNGHLTATIKRLGKHKNSKTGEVIDRGWNSPSTLTKAKKELIEAGLIMETRYGGNNKPTKYALTYLKIDEGNGRLDVCSTDSAPGVFKNPNEYENARDNKLNGKARMRLIG